MISVSCSSNEQTSSFVELLVHRKTSFLDGRGKCSSTMNNVSNIGITSPYQHCKEKILFLGRVNVILLRINVNVKKQNIHLLCEHTIRFGVPLFRGSINVLWRMKVSAIRLNWYTYND